jgi:outer membrane protein
VTVQTAAGRGAHVCGYHANQNPLAPELYLTGAEWNWAEVYKGFVTKMMAGEPLPNFVRGGIAEGFVKMSPYGPAVSEAAKANADGVLAEIKKGGYSVIKGPLKDNAGNEVVPAGTAYVELLRDASDSSDGTELRFGYRYEGWWNGQMRWRPYATFSWRDAKLNNYYYGVRPAEATPSRPAYEAGSGFGFETGMLGVYRFNAHWQAYGSFSVLLPPSAARDSPVVEDRQLTPSVKLGLMYSFTPQSASMGDRKPLIMRAFYGGSSECDLLPIMTLQCGKTHSQDGTSVAALEVGQTLVKGWNGWPVDIAGFVGLLRHLEDGNQDDFWQMQAYFKAYYYGFPWRETLRTRLGFGLGIAYASHIPFGEQRDQALRNRDTSKLLLYLDPSIDVNVGDLFRAKSLRETYFGLGVSHRSGIFGSAQLFNNVDGGSNYIYAYLQWQM